MTKRRQGQVLRGEVEEVGIGNCLVLAAVASVASFSSAKSKSASDRERERERDREKERDRDGERQRTQHSLAHIIDFPFSTWTTVAHASTLASDQANVACPRDASFVVSVAVAAVATLSVISASASPFFWRISGD